MTEGLRKQLGLSKPSALNHASRLLEEVLINDVDRTLKSYAHELSGGMRQRVLIAIAFSCKPNLIIADEPTTALDVTVQKHILRLLKDMQNKHRTSLLFVSHDLGVIAKLCDSVYVLHAGRVVEHGLTKTVFESPKHDYTKALFAATPRFDKPAKVLHTVPTELTERMWRDAYAYDGSIVV